MKHAWQCVAPVKRSTTPSSTRSRSGDEATTPMTAYSVSLCSSTRSSLPAKSPLRAVAWRSLAIASSPVESGAIEGGPRSHCRTGRAVIPRSSRLAPASRECQQPPRPSADFWRSEELQVAVELPLRDLLVGGLELGALDPDEVVEVVLTTGVA